MLYFPPYLISASALAVKAKNPKTAYFLLNAVCCYANKPNTFKLSLGYS